MIMLNTSRGEAAAEQKPHFAVGQVVHHKRRGYRGVIVEYDEICQADDSWSEVSAGAASREQPWYHVLVHGSGSVTYVEESSLEPDLRGGPVEHPLIDEFFSHFDGRTYHRNDEPWM